MGGKDRFLVALALGLIMLAFWAGATKDIYSCSCSIIDNPILITNPGPGVQTYILRQSGPASAWSTLTLHEVTILPSQSKTVGTFITPKCGITGDYAISTEIASKDQEAEILQAIHVVDCHDAARAGQKYAPSSDKPISGLLVTSALLLILLVLAAALLAKGEGKYYSSIRLSEPRISHRLGNDRRLSPAWIPRAILIAAILILVIVSMAYIIRLAGQLPTPTLNSTNAANASINVSNTVKSVAATNSNKTNASMPTGFGLLKPSEKRTGNLVTDYGGYVILGFILLIVLIAVIGRKEEPQSV